MFASQKCKEDLEKERKSKMDASNSLKRKLKSEELENVKRKKTELQSTINSLRDSFEKETLNAYENRDLNVISKAAAFLRSFKEKENTLKELDALQDNIEKDLKAM